MTLDVADAPVCRTAAPVIVGASLDETVRVHCAVDADPRDVRFTWRLTNSADTFEVSPQKTGPHNATTSELRYQPESDKDYGTLTCWGRNSVGGQTDPCVFRVIPASKYHAVALPAFFCLFVFVSVVCLFSHPQPPNQINLD